MTKKSNADYLRELRAAAREKGFCGECRARPAKPGRVSCETCLDKHAARRRAYLDVGLCECGAEPERDRVSCRRCLDAANALRKRVQAEHVDLGLCRRCDAPRVPGYSACEAHLRDDAERATRRNRNRYRRGLCAGCDWSRLTDHRFCATCRAADLERQAIYRARVRRAS